MQFLNGFKSQSYYISISRVNRALKDGAGGYAIAFERLQETEAGKESV